MLLDFLPNEDGEFGKGIVDEGSLQERPPIETRDLNSATGAFKFKSLNSGMCIFAL